MLFARGVILVEGDAERFLVPAFAHSIEKPLDHLGITVCSVAGTNFVPYAKFLAGLGIPFSVITDWDPQEEKKPLGYNRSLKLVSTIERVRTGESPANLIRELNSLIDYNDFCHRCEEYGIYSNIHTLEVDLFREGFRSAIIETLRERRFGADRMAWIDEWEADPKELDKPRFLSLIDEIGKGRFAQRLASRIDGLAPPDYIARAIMYVAERV
jgi:putative ATP-dependent endonuclease of the OLD family